MYFTNEELSCRCGCGFKVTPDFEKRLIELRKAYGKPMVVTSAARCKAHNTKVGGAPASQHVNGLAVDIKATPAEAYEIAKLALQHGFTGIGVHPKFIHLDLRGTTPVLWQYSKG